MPENEQGDPTVDYSVPYEFDYSHVPYDYSEWNGLTTNDMHDLINEHVQKEWASNGIHPMRNNAVDVFMMFTWIRASIQYLIYHGIIDNQEYAAFHARVMLAELKQHNTLVMEAIDQQRAAAIMVDPSELSKLKKFPFNGRPD